MIIEGVAYYPFLARGHTAPDGRRRQVTVWAPAITYVGRALSDLVGRRYPGQVLHVSSLKEKS